MVKKIKHSDLYRAQIMNLKTGDMYSANAGDYWNIPKSKKFSKGFVLVVKKPVSGKGVVGGHKLVVLKNNPCAGDLVDQTYPESKSKQIYKKKLKKVM